MNESSDKKFWRGCAHRFTSRENAMLGRTRGGVGGRGAGFAGAAGVVRKRRWGGMRGERRRGC